MINILVVINYKPEPAISIRGIYYATFVHSVVSAVVVICLYLVVGPQILHIIVYSVVCI